MFGDVRTISDILRASTSFTAGVASGDARRIVDGAGQLADVAGRHLTDLRGSRSNNLIERNRVYKDGVTDFLVECCEGLVGCHRAMLSAFGRDDAALYQAIDHMIRYLGLVGEATGMSGMSPHAMVGIPSASVVSGYDDGDWVGSGWAGGQGFGKQELHVITDACADVLDLGCVEACPVDCIYIGDRMAYIHPTECIECGDCMSACPVGAIFPISDLPSAKRDFARINAEYFTLPHRHAGSPGGAALSGSSGVDHPDAFLPSQTRPEPAQRSDAAARPPQPEMRSEEGSPQSAEATVSKSKAPAKNRATKKSVTAKKGSATAASSKRSPLEKPEEPGDPSERSMSAGSARPRRPSGRLPITPSSHDEKAPEPPRDQRKVEPEGEERRIDVKKLPRGSLNATARRLLKRDRFSSAELLFGQLVRFYDVDLSDEKALKLLDDVAESVWARHQSGGGDYRDASDGSCISVALLILISSVVAAVALVDQALAVVR